MAGGIQMLEKDRHLKCLTEENNIKVENSLSD